MRARYSWVWFLILLFVPLMFPQASSIPPVLRVEEQKIRFLTVPANRIELPVISSAHQALAARVEVELLKENDRVLGSSELKTPILPGSHTLVIPWTSALPSNFVTDLHWWRLRYQVISTPAGSTVQDGIVQLSRIIPD